MVYKTWNALVPNILPLLVGSSAYYTKHAQPSLTKVLTSGVKNLNTMEHNSLQKNVLFLLNLNIWSTQFLSWGTQNRQQKRAACFATLQQKSWKVMLRVLPPTFKLYLQQIRLLQVAWILTSDWIKLHGSHVIRHGSNVTSCKIRFILIMNFT